MLFALPFSLDANLESVHLRFSFLLLFSVCFILALNYKLEKACLKEYAFIIHLILSISVYNYLTMLQFLIKDCVFPKLTSFSFPQCCSWTKAEHHSGESSRAWRQPQWRRREWLWSQWLSFQQRTIRRPKYWEQRHADYAELWRYAEPAVRLPEQTGCVALQPPATLQAEEWLETESGILWLL